jgi:hypothetical protein
MTNGKADKIKSSEYIPSELTVKIYSYADIAFVGGVSEILGPHDLLQAATLEFQSLLVKLFSYGKQLRWSILESSLSLTKQINCCFLKVECRR